MTEIDKKISDIEKEVIQKKAKLDRDLLKLYQRMEKAGASRSAKDERRKGRTIFAILAGL